MSGMIATALLVIHIAAGSAALVTAGVALITAKGGRWHVLAGRIYAVGMTIVFLTAAPLAALVSSSFLFLIALFSFYLVFCRLAVRAKPATARPSGGLGLPSPPSGSPDWRCGVTRWSWLWTAVRNG